MSHAFDIRNRRLANQAVTGSGLIRERVRARQPDDSRPPVLLVPGALTGAWIWKDTFLPAIADAGYEVAAMSFRAHGRRGLDLHTRSFGDFVADLDAVIDSFGTPPILIAHSLGGLVAQHVLARRDLPAAALLSPVPPHGVLPSLVHLGRLSPLNLLKFAAVAVEPRVTRIGSPPDGIYSATCDPDLADRYTQRLQAESVRALARLARPPRLAIRARNTPLLFIGAEGDHIIPPAEVRRGARAWDAEVRIYPGMSHTFQAEAAAGEVVRDLLDWLEARMAQPQRAA